jgi:hypothetical protein
MNDKAIYLNFKFQTKYSLNDEIDKFSFFQNDLCQTKVFLFNLRKVFHLKSNESFVRHDGKKKIMQLLKNKIS